MKNFAQLMASFCFVILTFGCSGGSRNSEPAGFALNTDTVFKVGETRRIENTNTTIKLDTVTSDSRCGEDQACFVSGTAGVRVLISDSVTKNESFILLTNFNGTVVPATQTRFAYNIVVRVVEPQYGPGTPGIPTFPQKDYKVTLRVTPQ